MMRKADPCASWERTQRKGWQTKRKENSTEHATTAAKTGHRSRDCWSERCQGKAKANRRAKEDTPRVSVDTKAATTTPAATRKQARSRTCMIQNHVYFYRSLCIRAHVMETGAGRFGGLSLFGFNRNKFGAPAEETTVEIPHVEQHVTSERTCKESNTIGDALGMVVQKRHTEFTGVSPS